MLKRISLLPAIALLLAVAASAFGLPRFSTSELWEYRGPVGDEANPENYFLVSQAPNDCGSDVTTVCTIQAQSDGDPVEPHPILNGDNPLTDPGFSTSKRADRP